LKILTNAMRSCRKGPEAWFTGTVWIDELGAGATPSRFKVNRVSFEPAARTAWHTHPMGQALHVLTGVGRVQLADQPIQKISPGDSVWIEAGERHWHGADAAHTMVHLAIQQVDDHGVDVVWLEHVTDQEYSAPPG
jgi:quercetin dioxygenase-like cupin family protein